MGFKNVYVDCLCCAKPIHHMPAPDPLEACPHCGAHLEWDKSYDDVGDPVWTLVRATLEGKRQ